MADGFLVRAVLGPLLRRTLDHLQTHVFDMCAEGSGARVESPALLQSHPRHPLQNVLREGTRATWRAAEGSEYPLHFTVRMQFATRVRRLVLLATGECPREVEVHVGDGDDDKEEEEKDSLLCSVRGLRPGVPLAVDVPAVLCHSLRFVVLSPDLDSGRCSLARIRIFGTPALTEENLRQASPSALLRLLRQVPVSLKESASMLHADTAAAASEASFPQAKL